MFCDSCRKKPGDNVTFCPGCSKADGSTVDDTQTTPANRPSTFEKYKKLIILAGVAAVILIVAITVI